MNKTQLIELIAEGADITKIKAALALETFMGIVTKTLKAKDTITLIGFGSFSTANRAARMGRNPKTGKEIKIAATVTPKFKAGKLLKEAVAGKTVVKKVVAKKPVKKK